MQREIVKKKYYYGHIAINDNTVSSTAVHATVRPLHSLTAELVGVVEGEVEDDTVEGEFVDFIVCVAVFEPEAVWPTVEPGAEFESESEESPPLKSKMPAEVTAPVELSAFL